MASRWIVEKEVKVDENDVCRKSPRKAVEMEKMNSLVVNHKIANSKTFTTPLITVVTGREHCCFTH